MGQEERTENPIDEFAKSLSELCKYSAYAHFEEDFAALVEELSWIAGKIEGRCVPINEAPVEEAETKFNIQCHSLYLKKVFNDSAIGACAEFEFFGRGGASRLITIPIKTLEDRMVTIADLGLPSDALLDWNKGQIEAAIIFSEILNFDKNKKRKAMRTDVIFDFHKGITNFEKLREYSLDR